MPRQFRQTMSQMTEEKRVVVMVQRGKQRQRLETRIVLPRRDAVAHRARAGQIRARRPARSLIVSRTVTEMRVTIPDAWTGAGLFWNGLAAGADRQAGLPAADHRQGVAACRRLPIRSAATGRPAS